MPASIARAALCDNTAMTIERDASFVGRGGLWVLAQALILLGAALLPVASGAGRLWPTGVWPWIGVAIVIAGGGVIAAGLIALGDALTPFPRPRSDAALRTRGIYGVVRHPIYSGLVLAVFGWSLWWLSAWGAGYALLVLVFLDRKAAREERWLEARHPDYNAYRERVAKLVPHVY